MKFGVFGTGMVGQEIATKLVALGHDVCMGSRSQDNKAAAAWMQRVGQRGKSGTFREAAHFGEILLNCTHGSHSLDTLRSVDRENLAGKILIDVANPLSFTQGMPPTLAICNTDSLGEQIQREFPDLKVVKTLNTVNCRVMVDPKRVPGEHDVFICGNDDDAKSRVLQLLRDFGWKSVIDLGGIIAARATEQLMPVWLRLYGTFGTADFNFRVVRA